MCAGECNTARPGTSRGEAMALQQNAGTMSHRSLRAGSCAASPAITPTRPSRRACSPRRTAEQPSATCTAPSAAARTFSTGCCPSTRALGLLVAAKVATRWSDAVSCFSGLQGGRARRGGLQAARRRSCRARCAVRLREQDPAADRAAAGRDQAVWGAPGRSCCSKSWLQQLTCPLCTSGPARGKAGGQPAPRGARQHACARPGRDLPAEAGF